jgi:cytochrome c-type biogenesis protein CcsB
MGPGTTPTSIIAGPRARRSAAGRLLDVISSVWTGIALLAVLFVYCSIGSAVPAFRQLRAFEMTEFEWFHWWPFDVLVALICLVLVVTTVRRIPFKPVNYGVWMIHGGIIVLAVGSVIYYGTKEEGDAPVARRQVVVRVPGHDPVSLVAMPGNSTHAGPRDNPYHVQISGIDPQWEMLSGADAGQRAYKVSAQVQTADQTFIRDLMAGYPQYTQDLVRSTEPGAPWTRAVKALGKPLVDEALELSLEYAPQEWFYLSNDMTKSWALYLREVAGDGPPEPWVERPIEGLPLYNDYVADLEDVWLPGSDAPRRPRPLHVEIPPAVGSRDPLGEVTIIARSYLRYAVMDARREMGGGIFDPAVNIRLEATDGRRRDYQLVALDAAQRSQEQGQLVFEWVDDPEQLDRLLEIREPLLKISVPAASIEIEVPVRQTLRLDPDLPFTRIEGTDYSYRVRSIEDGLQLPSGVVSVAFVEIDSPPQKFLRWVFDEPSLSRDLADPNDPDAAHGPPRILDPNIAMEYVPGAHPAPVTIVGGPEEGDLRLVLATGGPAPDLGELVVGRPVNLSPSITLTVLQFAARTSVQTRPAIVPLSQRDRDARAQLSMIQVELPGAGGVESHWLPFHHWPIRDPSRSLRGAYRPTEVVLGDGRRLELMFSRQRRRLPSPVVLEDFVMDTHIGGFTGQNLSVLNWTSEIKFRDGDRWTETEKVSVNDPREHGGYSYYQAQWDPPDASRGYGGLNFTVLGVGNRHGVNVMLFGCCLSVLGMIYAFYVKPVIKRRRQRRPGDPIMTRRMLIVSVSAAVLGVLLVAWVWYRGAAARPAVSEPSAFARQVDLAPLGRVAVYEEGRVKSFDSYASATLQFVSGPHAINGNPDGFSYLDLMLRPDLYAHAAVIYVKNKPMRGEIAAALGASMTGEQVKAFRKTGMISEELLLDPGVGQLLDRKRRDLIRTAKAVQQIETAMFVKQSRVLERNLALVPPAGEHAVQRPWTTVEELGQQAQTLEFTAAWGAFTQAWKAREADDVNSAAVRLAALLPQVNPELYPNQDRLAWESWYFQANNMTWVWLIYLLSVVLLVMSVVYRWSAARRIGLGVFLLAFGLHTFALLLRWYVSGRWPNSNMFEAVTTSAWFGGCLAVIMEILVRRTPMRTLFALGSAVASMVALMCVHFMPVQLNANISNRMPVLHDVWLYIHTNVIIFSYCLITMAAVSSAIYLIYRLGGGKADHVRVGGAGALIQTTPTGESYLAETSTSAGQVLDGATMVLMELAFIMLWAGLVMGAIWADHSWGRPWGWDPKEVFALNTFIILALLVHTRLKVKDKGLWTAVLAMAGFGVMMFNWIVINFVIVGLHSYA